MRLRSLPAIVAALILLSCAPHSNVVSVPVCGADWSTNWTADSLFTFCLPPGWLRTDRDIWRRPSNHKAREEWFTILVLRPTDRHFSNDTSRLHLAIKSPCEHCEDVEHLNVYRDSVATGMAYIEEGLVTGYIHDHDPMLVASLILSHPQVRLIIYGQTAKLNALDTLRGAIRSIKLAAEL